MRLIGQNRALTRHLGFAALSGLAGLCMFRLMAFFYQGDYGRAVDAARGVTMGLPHWRVFQSRVLGPYLIALLSNAFPSYLAAHVFYSIAMVALAGYLVLVLFERRYGDRWRSLANFFLLLLLFIFLMSRPWLYAWDYIELVVFLVFVDLASRGADWRAVVAVFAVAIFNRESAYFIALWLILQPAVEHLLARWRRPGRSAPFDWRPCAAGALCLALGLAIVEGLRSLLLVREIGPEIFRDAPKTPQTQTLRFDTLFANVEMMWSAITGPGYALEILLVGFVLAFVVVAVLVIRRDPERWLALALVHLGLLGSLLMYGFFRESRIFVVLLPFLLYGINALADPPPEGTARLDDRAFDDDGAIAGDEAPAEEQGEGMA